MALVRWKPGRLAATAAATFVALVALLAATISPTWAWVTTAPAGSPVNFVGTGISLTDAPAAQTITCTSLNAAGSVSVAAGSSVAYGTSVANLTTVTSSGCTNPMTPCTITSSAIWGFALTGPGAARFSNVKLVVTCSLGCTFTAEGVLDGNFDQTTGSPTYQRFTPVGSSLVVSGSPAPSAPGCVYFGIGAGDDITVGGYWTNTGTPI